MYCSNEVNIVFENIFVDWHLTLAVFIARLTVFKKPVIYLFYLDFYFSEVDTYFFLVPNLKGDSV